MATTSVGVSWVWLLFLSGIGALPLGGAPLPLDPKLSIIAPEECLWYAAYSGQGPADSGSANRTEQLLAEPQVREFAKDLESQVMSVIRRGVGAHREQRVLATEVPTLIKVLLARPSAAYVEDVKPKQRGADVTAAFVLNAGEQRGELESALAKLLELATETGPKLKLEQETTAGIEWRRAPMPSDAPVVRFGWKDEYFIVAVGDATPEGLLRRMDASGASGPGWLRELRDEHPVERELSVGYLNVAGILERVRPLVEAKDPKAWPAIEKLALTSIRALHGVSGYDAEACVSMVHLVTDGERPGLLGLLPHEPLAEDDLAIIPKDALLAFGKRVDAGEAWDKVVDLASHFDPRARENVDRGLWEVENKLGVNLREDVLGSLDDKWVAYLPGGDVVSSGLNAVVAVRVRDQQRLRQAIDKLVSAANAELGRNPRSGSIDVTAVDGATVYTLKIAAPVPVAPSWTVSNDWLVLGLSPQAVRSALGRKAEDSLAQVAAVREALASKEGAAMLGYQDTPQLVRSVYPWLQIGLQAMSGKARQAGVEIDFSAMPTLEVILPHLRPGVATLTHTSDGFHLTSRHSLPGEANLAAGAPIVAALLLPAVGNARQAAQTAQETNHLKQIALAFHNYVDTHKRFPTDIYDEDGKPLLSWRVQLLPYMEEVALQGRLKLDEPWDSEHNKQFLGQMPATFGSPSSPELQAQGKTRFVALKGDDTLHPGQKELSFRNVTDGTSNTILYVRTAPDHAVEWTKPADLEFNAERPMTGLESPEGAFLAAFCDGSVRRIGLWVGGETVKALATRAGGEVINQQQLDAPPAIAP